MTVDVLGGIVSPAASGTCFYMPLVTRACIYGILFVMYNRIQACRALIHNCTFVVSV